MILNSNLNFKQWARQYGEVCARLCCGAGSMVLLLLLLVPVTSGIAAAAVPTAAAQDAATPQEVRPKEVPRVESWCPQMPAAADASQSLAPQTAGAAAQSYGAAPHVEGTSPAKPDPAKPAAAASFDRDALLFTDYDLDLLIRPEDHHLAVRGKITVLNQSKAALHTLPLQISSTLHWIYVAESGKRLPCSAAAPATDLDHTAAAQEARVELPAPLAPGEKLTLDVLYEGTVPLSGERLEAIGAPKDAATRSDWDRVDGDFVGVRGFGNVLWYPVSVEPVSLGDGSRLFHEIGVWKARERAATMTVRLRVDLSGGSSSGDSATGGSSEDAAAGETPSAGENTGRVLHQRVVPNLAIVNGQRIALAEETGKETGSDATSSGLPPENASLPTIGPPAITLPKLLTGKRSAATLGFGAPSLFLLRRTKLEGAGFRLELREENSAAASGYENAAQLVAPLIEQWLGKTPPASHAVMVVDLPAGLAPFEDVAVRMGDLRQPLSNPTVYGPLESAAPEQLATVVVHAMAHGAFSSSREWLNEGVPQFLSTLWIEKNQGRDIAMGRMDAHRSSLALAEPTDREDARAEPLIDAVDEIDYRVKATYVLWMLRAMIGDGPLAVALKNYRPVADVRANYFEQLVEAASKRDLKWFFDDWVYHDAGLPDFKIANIFSRKISDVDGYLISVDVENSGNAAAEVPVTVRGKLQSTMQRVRVNGHGQATVRLTLPEAPIEVTVNDGTVPEVTASEHRRPIVND